MSNETKSGTPKLNAALARAQKAMRAASKDKTNPHFKSKYADGAEVWSVWQEVGPDQGLSILQRPLDAAPGYLRLGLTLLHDSGEERDCGIITLKLAKDDPQGYGSALTYASRYIMKAVGIASEEDDDANAASSKPARPAAKPAPAKPPDDVDREVAALRAIADRSTPATAAGDFGAIRLRLEALRAVMDAQEWRALGLDIAARKKSLTRETAAEHERNKPDANF